jgi:hypothetical protein
MSIILAMAVVSACTEQAEHASSGSIAEDPQTEGAQVDYVEVEEAAVGDQALKLFSRIDQCAVRLDDGDLIVLGLSAPCVAFLHRNGVELPTVQHYPDTGYVVLVAGSPAGLEEYHEDDTVTPEDRCSSQAQGIVVHEGVVRLGKVQESRVSYCPEIGLDEKNYYGVAYLSN